MTNHARPEKSAPGFAFHPSDSPTTSAAAKPDTPCRAGRAEAFGCGCPIQILACEVAMTFAVFDFAEIAKLSRLKEMDGRPQNVVSVREPNATTIAAFQELEADGGMYLTVYGSALFKLWATTAPEYSPPDFDPA